MNENFFEEIVLKSDLGNYLNQSEKGTLGQFAVNDGNNGITWITLINGNEVKY